MKTEIYFKVGGGINPEAYIGYKLGSDRPVSKSHDTGNDFITVGDKEVYVFVHDTDVPTISGMVENNIEDKINQILKKIKLKEYIEKI